MYEVDFFAVGQAGRHGDAVAVRFTRPDTGGNAHLIIDAGFQDNGAAFVEHVQTYYNTTSIDLAIVTHPDGDHIGGMGAVIREFDVGVLAIHRLRERGGDGLPAADAVDELIAVAGENRTAVVEPFAGTGGFGGALSILGPTPEWYEQLVAEQQQESGQRAAARRPSRLAEAARQLGQRFLAALPAEIPFDDAGGTNPRNNSSVVTMLTVDGHRMLFPADAGVPALSQAWDWLAQNIGDTRPPDFVQMPHHGSRHNASSALLNRVLGPTGQEETKRAFVNVGPDAKKHPSPRVVNAFKRRGYGVGQTRTQSIRHSSPDAPPRDGWIPLALLEPMDESAED